MKTILVVDDNHDLVDGIKLTLEMEGFEVLTAFSGQEALQVLEHTIPDLILADIMMPHLDGYELYIRVHRNQLWMKIPFIFLTAKTSDEDVRKGKEMGVDDYITKPFDPQDLVAAIRGKLKRVAELSGGPTTTEVWPHVKYVLQGRIGPVPVPVLILLLVAALVSLPVLFLRPQAQTQPQAFSSPLRADVSEMVTIPAGKFIMGGVSNGAKPPHEVYLPTYQIDRYEVTMEQYHAFVEETGHAAPWGSYAPEMADYPVTNISWDDARAYCAWAGKKLPTEAEWEKAARGTDGRTYPWGDTWREGVANTKEGGAGSAEIVGSYPQGASPYGVEDMAGNVWEWTEDWYNADQLGRVIRGGAWNAIHSWAQAFARNQLPPQTLQENVGFRCAREAQSP